MGSSQLAGSGSQRKEQIRDRRKEIIAGLEGGGEEKGAPRSKRKAGPYDPTIEENRKGGKRKKGEKP